MDRLTPSVTCCYIVFLLCFHHAATSDFNYDEVDQFSNTNGPEQDTAVATTMQTYRRSRTYRRGYQGGQESPYQDDHHDDHDVIKDDESDMKAISQPKVDYWGGYYDFLINEGSYKFWAVFQLATAALLIYSGFAALYYAKVNPPTTDDEFDDIFRRRRKRGTAPISARERSFCGLDSATFQRIVDAIAKEIH